MSSVLTRLFPLPAAYPDTPRKVTLFGEARDIQPPANVIPLNRRKTSLLPQEDEVIVEYRVQPLITADMVEDGLHAHDDTKDYARLEGLIHAVHASHADYLGRRERELDIVA